MRSAVVGPLDPAAHGTPRLRTTHEAALPDAFFFEAPEEALGHAVLLGVLPAGRSAPKWVNAGTLEVALGLLRALTQAAGYREESSDTCAQPRKRAGTPRGVPALVRPNESLWINSSETRVVDRRWLQKGTRTGEPRG
jgi:hypothetical protein